MDPKVNLENQLRVARRILQLADSGLDDQQLGEEAETLADLVLAMHEWRGSGGFDPYQNPRVHVAVWSDSDGLNAQAYTTREGAERDYPGADNPLIESTDGPEFVTIIESTVQA